MVEFRLKLDFSVKYLQNATNYRTEEKYYAPIGSHIIRKISIWFGFRQQNTVVQQCAILHKLMFTVLFTLHKYDSDPGECRGLGLMPGGCQHSLHLILVFGHEFIV